MVGILELMDIFAVLLALTIWLAISFYGIRLSYRRKQKVLLTVWILLFVVVTAYIVLSLLA